MEAITKFKEFDYDRYNEALSILREMGMVPAYIWDKNNVEHDYPDLTDEQILEVLDVATENDYLGECLQDFIHASADYLNIERTK